MNLPGTPFFRIFYMTIGVLILVFLFLNWSELSEPVNLSSGTPKPAFEQARQIEMAWIDKAFPQLDYLLAPVSPLPCPAGIQDIPATIRDKTQLAIDAEKAGDFQYSKRILAPLIEGDSTHWLPVLTLAVLYAKHNEERYALPVLENYLKARLDLIKASTEKSTRSAVIHLLYMYGLLRLKTAQHHGNYDLLWESFKRPIGMSKLLISGPKASKQPIPTPGCGAKNKLTTYALYNNLIVGYIKTKNFRATRNQRKRECRRSQALDKNPLFSVLKVLCPSNNIEEYWVWAISNAETLLATAPEPPDSLLSFNLMLLIDSVIQRRDQAADVQNALLRKRDDMRRLSLNEWQSAPKEYKSILASSLAKLATTAAVNHGDEIPTDIESYLTEKQAEVIKAIRLTVSIRNGDYIDWLTKRGDEIKHELGTRADEWLEAMDIPHTLWGMSWQPDKVVKLVGIWIVSHIKGLAIFFSAIFVWIFGYWFERQLRERKALFTSFYQLEAEHIPPALKV
ncbi:MAG: hypothetical protein ABFS56_04440 [Pseudomonadota bacterium]